MSDAIVVRNLSKRYRRFDPDRAWTLEEAFFQRLRGHRPTGSFWVLRGINFSVPRGRTVGLIGRNGAGKSTLLRLIGGVGRPEEGSVSVHGRISALLDLGVGFHPDLSGRENVFIGGVIGGLTRQEVANRYDSIVDFAELRDSIHNPLRTYSSGMHMRLAFAVAIHTEPDILLIDEVLSVGDIGFQRKCLDRIAEFKSKGCTIAMVSHDPGQVSDFCDDVLWLEDGRIHEYGPAAEVVGHYVYEMETRRRTPTTFLPTLASSGVELRVNDNRFGSLELELENVRILDSYEQPMVELRDHGPLTVELDYAANDPVRNPIFGVTILDKNGKVCYDTNSEGTVATVADAAGRGGVGVRIEGLKLGDGQYYVEVGAYEHTWAYAYDYHSKAYPLLINHQAGNGTGITHGGSARAVWSLR